MNDDQLPALRPWHQPTVQAVAEWIEENAEHIYEMTLKDAEHRTSLEIIVEGLRTLAAEPQCDYLGRCPITNTRSAEATSVDTRSTWECKLCGHNWRANPPTECPECNPCRESATPVQPREDTVRGSVHDALLEQYRQAYLDRIELKVENEALRKVAAAPRPVAAIIGDLTMGEPLGRVLIDAWDVLDDALEALRSTPCAGDQTSGGEGVGLAHASDSEARPPMTTTPARGPEEAGTYSRQDHVDDAHTCLVTAPSSCLADRVAAVRIVELIQDNMPLEVEERVRGKIAAIVADVRAETIEACAQICDEASKEGLRECDEAMTRGHWQLAQAELTQSNQALRLARQIRRTAKATTGGGRG